MKIPKKIKIGAYDWEVIHKDRVFSDGQECYGVCDDDSFKIVLSRKKNKSKQNLHETFIHECLHACEKGANLDLSEDTITRLSTIIYGVLKNNKFI